MSSASVASALSAGVHLQILMPADTADEAALQDALLWYAPNATDATKLGDLHWSATGSKKNPSGLVPVNAISGISAGKNEGEGAWATKLGQRLPEDRCLMLRGEEVYLVCKDKAQRQVVVDALVALFEWAGTQQAERSDNPEFENEDL